jgi:hypothetical protein
MWPLAVVAVAASALVGPDGVCRRRVADQGLGTGIEGRMAVVFPDPVRGSTQDRAIIYLKRGGRWCRVGTGDYVRGSNRVDRGGRNPSIRLIDRREQADDMYWIGGQIVLMRGGRQVKALDPPANGCK